MTTAIIGTGGLGSVIARQLAAGGEPLRISSANKASARALAEQIGGTAVVADDNADVLKGAGDAPRGRAMPRWRRTARGTVLEARSLL